LVDEREAADTETSGGDLSPQESWMLEKFSDSYTLYRLADDMFKMCAAQAEYDIEKGKDGKLPTSETGEQIGIGKTWWHKGKALSRSSCHTIYDAKYRVA
jgi:hypothetical protein